MSRTRREELLNKLVWSGVQYPLAEFVDKHRLPQVVYIEEGYYGEKELNSFGSDQVLTLHALRQRKKLLGEDSHGQALTISLDCPTKVHVHPLPADCKYHRIGADQLTLVFPRFKCFYVIDGYYKDEDESFESSDILEIKAIDTKTQMVKCQNVRTNQNLAFSLKCSGSFEPILNAQLYTLAEVKDKYGLPAKISFREADDKLSQSLSQCGEMLLLGELEETVVISTTVGRSTDARVCHLLQKDLDIHVCVAEGFLAGDETYASVVTTLHEDVQIKNLFDFDHLNAHQNHIAGSKYVPVIEDLLDREPMESVLRKHAEIRIKPALPEDKPPPRIVPRTLKCKKNLPAPTAAPKPLPKPPRSHFHSLPSFHSAQSRETSRGKTNLGVKNSGGIYNAVDEDSSDGGAYEFIPENGLANKSSSLPLHGSAQSGRTPRGTDLGVEKPGEIYEAADDNSSDNDAYEDINFRVREPPPYSSNYVSPVDKPSQHFVQRELPKLPTEGADNKPVQPSLKKLSKLLPRRLTPADNKFNKNKKAPDGLEHAAVPNSKKPEIPPKLPERPKVKRTSSDVNQSSKTLTPSNLRRKVKHLSDSVLRRSRSHDDGLDEHSEMAQVQDDYDTVFHNDPTGQQRPLLSSGETLQSSRDSKACRDEIYARVSRIPNDLKGLTVEGVAEVLVDLNMEQYVETFESEMIDGDMLKGMDLDTMQSLGVSLFHSKKLVKFIEGWRPALKYQ